jgi:GAF domain-containing protein
MKASLLHDETARLDVLRRYKILDTPPEEAFDHLTRLATRTCRTPIALLNLIDRSRQWFKSNVGLDLPEMPRDIGLCPHAILQRDVFIVDDASQDARFADDPVVTSYPHVRFYAGAPLISPEGHAIGTLCVIDRQPRKLRPEQAVALRFLASRAIAQLELRLKI